MAESGDITLAVILALFALIVWGNVRLLCFAKSQLTSNPSLQTGLTLVCVPGLLSGVFSLVGIIIPVWAGGWHLGVPACEVFGLFDNVLSGAANWMLALIIVERYVKQCSPTEHSATFSGRNLRLLTVGVILLQLTLTTGPFFGLGEYTYHRGQLALNVKFNVTSWPQCPSECKGFLSYYDAVTKAMQYDPLSVVKHNVTSEFSVIGRSFWTQDSLVLLLRMYGRTEFRKLMAALQSGSMQRRLADCLFPQDVRGRFPGLPQVQAVVEESDALNMETVYLPVQALGLCTMDFTSTNRHAAAGLAYIFSVCAPLPLALGLVAAVVGQRRLSASHVPFEEPQPDAKWELLFVSALRVTVGVGAVAGLVYLALNLCLAQGRAVDPVWLLWANLGLTFPRAALYVAWFLGRGSLLELLRDALCRCLHSVLRWRRRRTYQTPYGRTRPGVNNPCAV